MDGQGPPHASHPTVAYNPVRDEFLVGWEGAEESFREEIFGQRVSTAGAELGVDDRSISRMGYAVDDSVGDLQLEANPATGDYLATWTGTLQGPEGEFGDDDLVTWSGDESAEGEAEVYGQMLSGSGLEEGENDFQITTFGPAGDEGFSADFSEVADGGGGRFLVAYEAGTRNGPVFTTASSEHEARGDDELEIYARGASFDEPAPPTEDPDGGAGGGGEQGGSEGEPHGGGEVGGSGRESGQMEAETDSESPGGRLKVRRKATAKRRRLRKRKVRRKVKIKG